MRLFLFVPAALAFPLSFFAVNAAPVDLQSRQARLPSAETSRPKLAVCDTIELRKSNYASKCKKAGSLKSGVVQVKSEYDYHFVNTDGQMKTAISQSFNKANGGEKTDSGKNPATLIQCDHVLELQYVKYLFESSPDGAGLACEELQKSSSLKSEFLNLINGDLNLYNLDSKLNNYKGKVITTMVAAAKVGAKYSKITLPVLKSHPIPQVYSGLALYYNEIGSRQVQVAESLFKFLNRISGSSYEDRILLDPAAQVDYLTKVFNAASTKPSTTRIKRILPSAAQWITYDPKLLNSYYRNYNSVGTLNNGMFQEYLQEYHPEPPAEDEGEDMSDQFEVEELLGYGQIPTSLSNSNLLVLGDFQMEDSSPSCVRPRGVNETTLSCTLGGDSSPSNHSEVLPLTSNTGSTLSESGASESSLDDSSINVLPTPSLLNPEAAQTLVNTFNQVDTLDPINTLNRAQTLNLRPSSSLLNPSISVSPQLQPTLASTSVNTIVKTPIVHQSFNTGPDQNQLHATLSVSRYSQAIPTKVSIGRVSPLSTPKAKLTSTYRSTSIPTKLSSRPYQPIKSSFPPVATKSGTSRWKSGWNLFKRDASLGRR